MLIIEIKFDKFYVITKYMFYMLGTSKSVYIIDDLILDFIYHTFIHRLPE